MAIAYVNQAENSSSGGTTPVACTSSLSLSAGDAVEVQVFAASIAVITIVDGLGNTYTLQNTSATTSGSNALFVFVAQNCAAGAATISASTSASVIFGVYAKQISGAALTGAVIGATSNYQSGGPGSGANVIVSGNVNIPSAQNVLVSGFTSNIQFGTPVATAGTSPLAFIGRTAVWSVFAGGTAFSVPEDIRVVGASGNVQATFGVTGGGAQFDNVVTSIVVYAEAGGGGGSNTASIAWVS